MHIDTQASMQADNNADKNADIHAGRHAYRAVMQTSKQTNTHATTIACVCVNAYMHCTHSNLLLNPCPQPISTMHFANVRSRQCVLFSDLRSRSTTIVAGVSITNLGSSTSPNMMPLLPVGLPPAEYQEVGLPADVTHLKPSPAVPAEYQEVGLPVVPAEQPLSVGADDDLGDLDNGEEIDAAKLVRKLKMVKKEHAKLKKKHQEALKASQVWKQKCFDAKDEAKVWHDRWCQELKMCEVLAESSTKLLMRFTTNCWQIN